MGRGKEKEKKGKGKTEKDYAAMKQRMLHSMNDTPLRVDICTLLTKMQKKISEGEGRKQNRFLIVQARESEYTGVSFFWVCLYDVRMIFTKRRGEG